MSDLESVKLPREMLVGILHGWLEDVQRLLALSVPAEAPPTDRERVFFERADEYFALDRRGIKCEALDLAWVRAADAHVALRGPWDGATGTIHHVGAAPASEAAGPGHMSPRSEGGQVIGAAPADAPDNATGHRSPAAVLATEKEPRLDLGFDHPCWCGSGSQCPRHPAAAPSKEPPAPTEEVIIEIDEAGRVHGDDSKLRRNCSGPLPTTGGVETLLETIVVPGFTRDLAQEALRLYRAEHKATHAQWISYATTAMKSRLKLVKQVEVLQSEKEASGKDALVWRGSALEWKEKAEALRTERDEAVRVAERACKARDRNAEDWLGTKRESIALRDERDEARTALEKARVALSDAYRIVCEGLRGNTEGIST